MQRPQPVARGQGWLCVYMDVHASGSRSLPTKWTRPLFQGRTGCGWHDIVTCQRLVIVLVVIFFLHYQWKMKTWKRYFLCQPRHLLTVIADCNVKIIVALFCVASFSMFVGHFVRRWSFRQHSRQQRGHRGQLAARHRFHGQSCLVNQCWTSWNSRRLCQFRYVLCRLLLSRFAMPQRNSAIGVVSVCLSRVSVNTQNIESKLIYWWYSFRRHVAQGFRIFRQNIIP